MTIKPNTKLDPADLAPYGKGRPGKISSPRSSAFNLKDFAPPTPGVSANASASPSLKPNAATDLSPFKPGHPGHASAVRPLKLDEAGRIVAPPKTAAGAALANKSQHDQLVEKTQKWVSQTFFGTLLKQMGDSPFKSDLFSGGRGGEAFSSLYHQQLADRMSHAAGSKLVTSIVKKIEANQAKSSGVRVQGSEKKAAARPPSTQDPRTKAYERSRPAGGKQSTFSLAA